MSQLHETKSISCPIPHLPPREAWRVNPDTLQRFYPPSDDRGFVLPDATIETVLALFDDDYEWPVDWSRHAHRILRPDDHHFHWVGAWYDREHYRDRGKLSGVPMKFRNLPTNRGIIPRQFHNVIHEVTVPPTVPKFEHMEEYTIAFEVAKSLFKSARNAIMASERFMETDEEDVLEKLLHRYEHRFRDYRATSQKAMGVKVGELLRIEADLESPHELYRELGTYALRTPPNYVDTYFARAA